MPTTEGWVENSCYIPRPVSIARLHHPRLTRHPNPLRRSLQSIRDGCGRDHHRDYDYAAILKASLTWMQSVRVLDGGVVHHVAGQDKIQSRRRHGVVLTVVAAVVAPE